MSRSAVLAGPATKPWVRPVLLPSPGPSRQRQFVALVAAISVSSFGIVLLTFVYHWAQSRPPNYDAFWLGMLCMLGPVWLFALAPSSSSRTVLGSVTALGLLTYVPAYLRAPSGPVFGDALGHYLSVADTLRTGNLYDANPIVPIAADYPGLHALTAALVTATGAPIWDVAVVLIALFHVSTLLGIFAIVRGLGGSDRAGAIAAVVYSISPLYIFFDAEFAYESLAIPFLVWTLALLVYAQRTQNTRLTLLTMAASTFAAVCCVLTHHLTSYELAVLVIAIGLCQLAVKEYRGAKLSLMLGGLTAISAVTWVMLTGAPILSYLGYFPRTAFEAIGPIFDKIVGSRPAPSSGGVAAPTATRSLFTGSVLPDYERYAAYAVQLIAIAVTAVAAWRLRFSRSGTLVALAVLALTYFLLLPLRLSPAGEAGAGRVSTFQWIGIAVVTGLGIAAAARRRRSSGRHALPRAWASHGRMWRNRWLWVAATPLLFVGLVGNYGASVNAAVRFPGTFQMNSTNGRDTTPEAVQLARHFLALEGPNQRVASDSSTLLVFEAYAYAQPPGFGLAWQLFVPGYTSAHLQEVARLYDINAIVVDNRIAQGGGESADLAGAPDNVYHLPITGQTLSRLSSFKWLRVLFATQHYTVYEVVEPQPALYRPSMPRRTGL